MPDYAAAETSLERVYKRFYPLLVQRAVADVEADLGRRITPDAATAAQITAQIGARVQGVIATQQDRIATLVNTYEGDPAALKAALQVALDTSELRAGVIASSEVTHAFNSGTALACHSAGVKVQIEDGDEDEPCKSVNGTVQEAAWLLANPSGHPNCTRRAFPVAE